MQRPVRDKETNKWLVWDFAYEKDGHKYYELHEFWEEKDAIEFWKMHHTKEQWKNK